MPKSKQQLAERQPELPQKEPDKYCNARKRKGVGYCTRPAGWGTDHPNVGRCKFHGGSMPNHRKKARQEIARQGVKAFALPLNVEPHEALLQELYRTNGIIVFYEQQIHALEKTEDLVGPVGTEGTDAESDLQHHPKGEANVWVRLHREERQHLTKVAETCIKAGIAERQIELAEQQGAIIATVIRNTLIALKIELTEEVRKVVRQQLMDAAPQSIEGSAVELITAKGKNGKT